MAESIGMKWLTPKAQPTAPVTFGAPWARGPLKGYRFFKLLFGVGPGQFLEYAMNGIVANMVRIPIGSSDPAEIATTQVSGREG